MNDRYCVNVLSCGNKAAPKSDYCTECQRQMQDERQSVPQRRIDDLYTWLTTKPERTEKRHGHR